MPETLESAAAKLAAAGRALSDEDRVAQAFAELAVAQARRLAGGHPTPQSRLAATGAQARLGAIEVVGYPQAAIAWGSEFGSTIYRQFGPRHSRGSWLYPAGEDQATVDLFERTWIDQEISRATGGH